MNANSNSERRRDERQDRVRHRHVVWTKSNVPSKSTDGWICNISRGGIALLVRNSSRPNVGEVFEMDYDGDHLLCTVLRRVGVEQKVSIVGCRAEAMIHHAQMGFSAGTAA
jgi:PilZ domain